MQDSNIFKERVSKKRLLNVVKEISNYHRIQGSPMFKEAALKVIDICEKYGLKARILEYEADPDVWYMQSKMFKEWRIKEATLDLCDGDVRLCDFSAEPISVVQKSYPIDRRNDPVEVVYLDKGSDKDNYQDVDLNDRFVFTRTHLNTVDWVYEKGAIGVITDYVFETKNRSRNDLYNSLTYTSYWHAHEKDEKEKRGFVLSPKDGDKLAKQCQAKWEKEKAYIKIKPYIDSSLYNGHIQDVEVTIDGEDDRIVYLVAHLCHPKSSCNDNASGVSATLEAMNVINTLIKEGKIAKPRHTIKLLLIPEMTGTYPYLCEYDQYDKVLGAMNLDMVGGKQSVYYGPITLTKTPFVLPNIINEISTYCLKEAGKEAYSLADEPINMTNYLVESFLGGSDHIIFSDPSIGIPCCMLGQWPDLNYHTATDTFDVIDENVLKFSCLVAINFAYNLANISEDDLPYLYEELCLNMINEKSKLTKKYLNKEIAKDIFGSTLFKYKKYYIDCLRSVNKIVDGVDTSKMQDSIAGIFDKWISLYDAKDDFVPENDSNVVYKRNFKGPIMRLDDYKAIGYKEVVDKYNDSIKGNEIDSDLMNNLAYYIDGKRSLKEIIKELSLEAGKDLSKEILILINVYCCLNLIEEL